MLNFIIDLSNYNFNNIYLNSPELETIQKTLIEEISLKINRNDIKFINSYIDYITDSEKLIIELFFFSFIF